MISDEILEAAEAHLDDCSIRGREREWFLSGVEWVVSTVGVLPKTAHEEPKRKGVKYGDCYFDAECFRGFPVDPVKPGKKERRKPGDSFAIEFVDDGTFYFFCKQGRFSFDTKEEAEAVRQRIIDVLEGA